MAAGPKYRTQISYVVALMCLMCASGAYAQQVATAPSALTPVPRVVWFGGAFQPADGRQAAPVETVTLAVYADQQDGTPLWQETQTVIVSRDGRYNVLLGSTTSDGLPLDLFTTGEPRWLGVRFERVGENEQPRVHLASVPYALKAADAETLGGKPASAYLLAPPQRGGGGSKKAAAGGSNLATTDGTEGSDAGTMAASGPLDISFSDPNGQVVGLSVRNTASTGAPYSGMLFLDQAGNVAQFQGFNNLSHEYRINNVASNGSINFMIGSASKFLVANNGNVTVANNMSVNGNIAAKYQDVAEWVETSAPLEPGTVVIVDPKEPNRVLAAPKAYDTRVAGAVSRQPGLVLGEQGDDKAMVAQSGRVKVKADAKYGAIKIGDLLVTSPTPGYAMRSRPMSVAGRTMHRPGTLLGKALEALPSGQGEILVLLTLQ